MKSSEYDEIINDLTVAYKKLKSYIYYDNTLIDLRIKIANYEFGGIRRKLGALARSLVAYKNGENSVFNRHLSTIGFTTRPKRISSQKPVSKYSFVSNTNIKKKYPVEKIIHYIDCDVELHIISVYWLNTLGLELDRTIDDNNYAYRLIDYKYGKRLFYRYFVKYQAWRDNAIDEALDAHSEKKDVAFISLDIKEFFDSVDFDINPLPVNSKKYSYLTEILSRIHKRYAEVRGVTRNILPIGLLSSGVLANFHLARFDAEVTDKVTPRYYGRYVDDILLVIAAKKIDEKADLLKKYLVKSGVLKKEEGCYRLFSPANLTMQEEKIKIYLFKKTDSTDLLDDFKLKIKENASAFRFMPEEEGLLSEFGSNNHRINYSGSINKIRSIEGFDSDKYGLSKKLAEIITVLKCVAGFDDKVLLRSQINGYFKGRRNLEFYDLWEKILTVFVLSDDKVGFCQFIKNTIADLNKIENQITEQLIMDMIRHLSNCMSMAISLDIDFYDNKLVNRLIKITSQIEIKHKFSPYFNTQQIAENFRSILKSNLFRHTNSYFPLINVCKNENVSLKRYDISNFESWVLDGEKINFYPRFVHLHEFFIFYRIRAAFKSDHTPTEKQIYKQYVELNNLSDDYFKWRPLSEKKDAITIVSQTKNYNSFSSLRVSLVNTKIDAKDSYSNLKGSPNLSTERYFKINKLLNDSIREKSGIVIFPEIAVPIQWVNNVSTFSQKNNCSVVMGVEHFSNQNKEALNYSCVTLPFLNRTFVSCYVDMRLKINYAPVEIEKIEELGFKIPLSKQDKESMRVYGWKGNYFTLFNCYELTDVVKRSLFKGAVDYVVVIVHNMDTPYFSNIIESMSRDLHAYVVQVNTSNYGDSRITQPKKSVLKDIAKVKGGINNHILVDLLDIGSLRKFQALDLTQQIKSKKFKATPPDYSVPPYRK